MRPDISLFVSRTVFNSDLRGVLGLVRSPCCIVQCIKDVSVPVSVATIVHRLGVRPTEEVFFALQLLSALLPLHSTGEDPDSGGHSPTQPILPPPPPVSFGCDSPFRSPKVPPSAFRLTPPSSDTVVPQAEELLMALRRGPQDVGWQYGESVNERKDHVKCNYCHGVLRGGITRFKKHFVGTIGGIGPCASAPEEVREMIRQKLSEAERKRSRRASTSKLDAYNKRTGKIMTRLAKMELSTSINDQPEFVSDPPLCIPAKERGFGRRKHKDSKQKNKYLTSGNVQTESLCDSPLSVASMEQDIRKKNRIDSKQQKKLTIYGNVQTESASDPRPCIPSKELGSGKRKHVVSEQQKKIRTSGNVQTVSASDLLLFIPSKKRCVRTSEIVQVESVFDSSQCLASKEGTRERKGMDSKQQKKRGSSKEDTMQSFYDSYLPRYTRAKKLRGIKERCRNSEEQKKVDTNAFESFLEYLWSKLSDVKRKTCTYLDCLWFSLYMKGPSSKVLTWIKKKQIFSRKYVFVPIICWRHWSLLILCHFGESFLSKAKRPCMLLLDSLGNINPMRLEPDIRRFVFDIYKSEGCEEEESISKIPLLVPKLTENWFGWEDMENFHKEVLHFASDKYSLECNDGNAAKLRHLSFK
ncbi:hypothetical protein Taro_000315 [Colocasia esculenta]|uniref:Ubiquitin-like protease family profile domain-containing protein n=1 Tax=Colocasia esculenta TaxID=4460 RepID=A0A843TES0_COLES|nr:hypothetical protein [Colocasia esculenta]